VGDGRAAPALLVPQAQGAKLGTFALTEPGAGTDAANLRTTARREGDAYILTGSKIWISLADLADHFLVFATVDRARKHRGVTAFMLERGMPGLTTGTSMGSWASGPGTPAWSTSTAWRCPPRTGSARKARGSSSR